MTDQSWFTLKLPLYEIQSGWFKALQITGLNNGTLSLVGIAEMNKIFSQVKLANPCYID